MFFDVRKTKRIAKFDGLEPRRCEDMKGIVAPEIGPKSFGTFEKQATAPRKQLIECQKYFCDKGRPPSPGREKLWDRGCFLHLTSGAL